MAGQQLRFRPDKIHITTCLSAIEQSDFQFWVWPAGRFFRLHPWSTSLAFAGQASLLTETGLDEFHELVFMQMPDLLPDSAWNGQGEESGDVGS
jgi:hypothetical protein